MFFQESEAIAREHPDLLGVVEQVDLRLSQISAPSPLRPGDFSSALGAEENQVVSVFELLARKGVLVDEEMIECDRCQTLMPVAAFLQAVDDEDDFDCTCCGRVAPVRSAPVCIYRMTASAVSRTKAEADARRARSMALGIDSTDEPLSDRARDVLIAMLELGAVDSDSRKSTEEIAIRALGSHADANSLKSVMSELSTRRLIKTKTGRGGGGWLTPKGRSRVEKLRK